MSKEVFAELTKDGGVRLVGRMHTDEFELERLPSRIRFYRRLAAKPKYGRFYRATLDALINFKAQLEGQD